MNTRQSVRNTSAMDARSLTCHGCRHYGHVRNTRPQYSQRGYVEVWMWGGSHPHICTRIPLGTDVQTLGASVIRNNYCTHATH